MFLLGIPLKRLPFTETLADFSPPPWLIPWFAGGSLFFLSASTATGFFLRSFEAHAPVPDFLSQYYVEDRSLILSDLSERWTDAQITITDAAGNFGIYVNGWRVFSSETNCGLVFLCRKQDDWEKEGAAWSSLITELPKPTVSDYYSPHELYNLPINISIGDLLVPGYNFVDVYTSNPGRGTCLLQARITIISQHKYLIQPISSSDRLAEKNIRKYGTYLSYPNHRLCDRQRIEFTLPR
ncbi:MAG TPA: hypothetical protein VGR92_04365 [Steroidobacteraceae bacterium]|nr:hypothetical protein [Steroidobacteraceae bacterium]